MSQYTDGTINVTQGNGTIYGTDTTWLTSVQPNLPAWIKKKGTSEPPYRIASVTNDGELQISGTYAGISETDLDYQIMWGFTPNRGYYMPTKGNIDAETWIGDLGFLKVDADMAALFGYKTSDYSSFNAAISDIGATETVLIVDNDTSLSATLASVPDTLTVYWRRGGGLATNGYNVTSWAASFANEPSWDVFDTSGGGTITFVSGVANITDSFTWVVSSPSVTTIPGPRLIGFVEFTQIDAAVVGGTSVDLNIEIRNTPDDGTPTDIFQTEVIADTDGVSAANFGTLTAAQDQWLWLDLSAVTGSVTSLVVTLMFKRATRI